VTPVCRHREIRIHFPLADPGRAPAYLLVALALLAVLASAGPQVLAGPIENDAIAVMEAFKIFRKQNAT
jgi:hypothetical protein